MYPKRQEKNFSKKVLTWLNRFDKIAKLARKKGGGNRVIRGYAYDIRYLDN